jgi:SnoaL-like domain
MKTSIWIRIALCGALASSAGNLAAQPRPERDKTETPAQPAGLEQVKAARDALGDLIRAYEAGDLARVRAAVSPRMIGYQRFVDGVQRDFNALKQIRIHLFEAQVTAGPDVAAIQADWEKRFFAVADYQPGLFAGRSLFLLHRSASGWKLAAIAGDNPFSSQSGGLAQLQVGTMIVSRALLAPCSVPCNLPLQIELIDPDLAGASTVNVELSTSQGDVETVALTPVSPGRFVRNTLTFQSSPAPAPYSGAVNVNISAAPIALTVRYVDKDAGAGRPPSTLTRTIRITP